jgi:hypothetical protein
MKTFSGDKAGEDPSHQEWLASKGFKDPDALIASYRNAEKQIRESGKVKVPGADAKPEEIAAFREAMGIPKDVEGYTVEMPEGAEQYEIDTAILGPLKEAALEHNVTPTAFKALADKFLGAAVEHAKAEVARTDTEAADKVKEWGPKAAQNKEDFRRGAQILELTKADIADIQREFGAGRTLDLFAKIGRLAGEDFFASGNASQRFGVASIEQAQKNVDEFMTGEKSQALRKGDATVKAAYDRAVEALAHFREAESKKR